MHDPDDSGKREGRLDLVPMIDCIMLLLLFFILTTSFRAPIKQIVVLLPAKGPAPSHPTIVEEPHILRIAVYPDGVEPGDSAAAYQRRIDALLKRGMVPTVRVRIGGAEPFLLLGADLDHGDTPALEAALDGLAARIGAALKEREVPGTATRHDQVPVEIHCFSGLSWKYALVVLDAVRSYEQDYEHDLPKDAEKAARLRREIAFAPPRLRNYRVNERGEELAEILAVK
ncbi:MAG: biopolymer transporter ExbD [Planctomycetes bacterium]|nr:biopolymer transporter ExbD [Planctomycetota bacterium]